MLDPHKLDDQNSRQSLDATVRSPVMLSKAAIAIHTLLYIQAGELVEAILDTFESLCLQVYALLLCRPQ